jgi:CBS domain containing-hemolysin-like protein
MSDVLALLAAVALLIANGFFVGAEFALISVRRDRIEPLTTGSGALARAARTVLRATGQLPRMLASSQLAITVCSLLLGRLGEPAVADLVERPLTALGLPGAAVDVVGLGGSLLLVVVAHMLLGEMVPRNIAIAGPERAALLLVPPFLPFSTAVRPATALFIGLARGVLRLLRVRPRDEIAAGLTSGELADLMAESQREGLLDAAEFGRLSRTLSAVGTTVSDVLVPRDELVSLPPQPRVGDVTAAVAATGFSRFPVRSPAGGTWTGYLHVKDILDLLDADDPDSAGSDVTVGTEATPVPPQRVRGLPEVRADARVDAAVAALRAFRAHLARAVDPGGTTVGLVALEDLVEAFVGTVRDATHRGV